MSDVTPSALPSAASSNTPQDFAAFQAELSQQPTPQPQPEAPKKAPLAPPALREPKKTPTQEEIDAQDSIGQPAHEVEATGEPTEEQADEPTEETSQSLADQEALAKYREWEQSDELPDEFLDRLVSVPNGKNGTKYVTAREMQKGYMRQSDHTRAAQEFAAAKQGFDQKLKDYDDHFVAVKGDPDVFINTYEEAGFDLVPVANAILERDKKDKAFALAYARNFAEEQGLDGNHFSVRQAFDQAYQERQQWRAAQRELKIKNSEVDRLSQGAKKQESQQGIDARAAEMKNALNQLAPRALKAQGMKYTDPQHRDIFHRYLRSVMEQTQSPDITREICLQAAESAKEELEDIRAAEAGSARKPAPKQPLSNGRVGGGAGKMTIGTPSVQGTVDDFELQFINRR